MKDRFLFLSRYVHFLKQSHVVACYHSLRMIPVYVSDDFLLIIKKFTNGNSLQNVLDSIDFDRQEDFLSTVKALEFAKILINSVADDENALGYYLGLLGKPYPHLAYFILTERCNFRCKYCFIKNQESSDYDSENMSLEIALKGLDFFCLLIAEDPKQFELEKTIVFYGGEPLLNWCVLRILLTKIEEYIQNGKLPKRTILNMVTNGSLITNEIAEVLKNSNVQVSISIDGDSFATNSSRAYADGRPVYQDIKRGFLVCKEAGMNIGASCTLSEASISDFDTTIEVLLDECQITNLGFNLMITGEDKLNDGYNERAAKFIINAFKIFRERGVYEDRIMRKVTSFVESKVWLFDCGATGGNQIVIAPNGDVGVCHGFLAKRKYFPINVFDNDFNIHDDSDYKEWSMRSPINMPECQECFALGICGGGCPFQSEIEKGSIWALDDRFCIHAKMTLEWLIWDLFNKMKK
ncbi:MAG: SPASM domain-containing protein [Candidatus Pacebacteria bacterium]|nr:SPASM domain-containing protein [Candidatus Paceibacterota bacterium]